MLYAALGDSITYGFCSTGVSNRYANLLLNKMRSKPAMKLFVHAHPGWTSTRLLTSIREIPADVWDETKLVSLMIGGNDLLRAIPFLLHSNPTGLVRVTERLHHNLESILRTVTHGDAQALVGTLYNPFPNSPVAKRCTVALNQAIRCAAEENGATVADVYDAFTPHASRCVDRYRTGRIRDFRIVGNPIHPNDEGHRIIANQFYNAYQSVVALDGALQRQTSM